MHPQHPHRQQRSDMVPADSETQATVSQPVPGPPPLPPLDEAPTLAPRVPSHTSPPATSPVPATWSPSGLPTRPPAQRAARPTIPIRPPTLPGLEDEVRTADAEVRSEARALTLAPTATQRTLVLGGRGHENSTLLIRGAAKPPRLARTIVPRRNGPWSFLAQFLVAVLASAILVSTLALTTPLGQQVAATGAQFSTDSGLIQAPSPTATPKPRSSGPAKGVNPGSQVIIDEITAVFGQYATGALNVARCESGYDPNAVNSYPIGNSHASGVFQILYPSTWNTTSYAAYSPFDYDKNIRAAYEIFHRDGNSWREWACKP